MNSNHFTEENTTLLKTLANAIGINDIHFEIEDGENVGDTLVIEYSEYITYVSEDEPYIVGHIVHFPGSRDEPPDDDYLDRVEYHTFVDAALDVIQHIATERISEAMEFHYLANLPPDPPGSPVWGFRRGKCPYDGFEGAEA